MKFTNEDLLKIFKVKLGDTVVIKELGKNNYPNKFSVGIHISNDGEKQLVLISIGGCERYRLQTLINYEYDVYEPKKIGNKKCGDFESCFGCPLNHLRECDDDNKGDSLYDILNHYFDSTDDPIYKAYKAILDKEE